MGYEWEREILKLKYPGIRWTQRVNKMTEDQVIAAYLKLIEIQRKGDERNSKQ